MKKLTAKKLDAHISNSYAAIASGKSINVMDIGKVYKAAREAYALTGELAAVDAVIAAKVDALCVAHT